jgi:enoyl-[acyl-carrier-protein] reductase (NADH)
MGDPMSLFTLESKRGFVAGMVNGSGIHHGCARAFLVSDAARAVTGPVVHIDCGYHVTG